MQDTKGDLFRGGIIAGFIGGAALALVMVLPVLGNAQATWPSLQVASYPFLGPQAFHPDFHGGAMALGMVIHFALACGWAVLFTFLVSRTTRVMTVLLSPLFGVAVFAVMYLIVLPLLGGDEFVRKVPPAISIVQHVFYGLAVGLTLALFQPQNWRSRRTRRALAA